MRLTGRLYLQDSLIERATMDELQGALEDVLPEWADGLAVAKNEDAKRALLAGEGASLCEAVEKVAPVKWGFNSAVITGAYEGLTLFVKGSRTTLPPESNMISVEILDLPSVEGKAPWDPLGAFVERIVARIIVRYAYACTAEEFDAKNMVDDESGVRAVGVNLLESLPGLYWFNYFGPPYSKIMGADRLRSAPAHEVRNVNDGILILLDDSPLPWSTESYKKEESAVIEHLGPQFFFSRLDPGRATVAATFERPRRG